MDKIFHSTFDFFTHAIPGFCLIASLFVLSGEVDSPMKYLEMANEIKVGGGVFLLVIGYIVGFAIYPLGRALYRTIGFRLWKKKMHHDIPIFIAEKYVLIREFSPANFKYVELWNMFCAMSHNLAIASLLLFVCSLCKLLFLGTAYALAWGVISIISIFLTLVFLHRAVIFSIWAADDINSTVSRLDLANKTRKANS